MPERDIAKHLKAVTKRLGGEAKKMRWEGRSHAPDYFIELPRQGVHCWVETKAPGEDAREGQAREHARMRRAGCEVYVLDTREKIDEWARGYE